MKKLLLLTLITISCSKNNINFTEYSVRSKPYLSAKKAMYDFEMKSSIICKNNKLSKFQIISISTTNKSSKDFTYFVQSGKIKFFD
jgi:hypothetical protein